MGFQFFLFLHENEEIALNSQFQFILQKGQFQRRNLQKLLSIDATNQNFVNIQDNKLLKLVSIRINFISSAFIIYLEPPDERWKAKKGTYESEKAMRRISSQKTSAFFTLFFNFGMEMPTLGMCAEQNKRKNVIKRVYQISRDAHLNQLWFW